MKPPDKLQRQMTQRGWTAVQLEEAKRQGRRFGAVNVATGGSATRYVHPMTGRSVVVDDETGDVIHVGGDGFVY